MKRFSMHVSRTLTDTGVISWLDVGDAVTVDGQDMVRLPGGTIVTADGWHDTLQAAQAAAADRLEETAACVAGQALRLRLAANAAEQARRLREVARG